MGYRIEYEGYEKEQNPKEDTNTARILLTLMFSAACFLLVMTCWQEGRELLLKLVIPGDPEQTIQAVCTFAEELRDGAPIQRAAAAFCESVISGEAVH